MVALSYRKDEVSVPMSSTEEVCSWFRSAFIKTHAVGCGVLPFSWEALLKPVDETMMECPFDADVIEGILQARRAVEAEIKPQHYNTVAELKQLLLTKVGLWRRHDEHMGLEIAWLTMMEGTSGIARVEAMILEHMPTMTFHPTIPEVYGQIDALKESKVGRTYYSVTSFATVSKEGSI